MPHGPGYYAWKGKDGKEWVRKLLVWELLGDNLVRIQWEEWEKPSVAYLDKYLEMSKGTYYCLTMPWEQRPAAPREEV